MHGIRRRADAETYMKRQAAKFYCKHSQILTFWRCWHTSILHPIACLKAEQPIGPTGSGIAGVLAAHTPSFRIIQLVRFCGLFAQLLLFFLNKLL